MKVLEKSPEHSAALALLAPARRAAVGRGEEDANHGGKQESQLTGCGAKSPTFYGANTPPPTWFSLGSLVAK